VVDSPDHRMPKSPLDLRDRRLDPDAFVALVELMTCRPTRMTGLL